MPPRSLKVLTLLGRLAIATIEQLNCALYSKGTITTTSDVLKTLYDRRYVDREYVRFHLLGNPRVVYKLRTRGFRFLASHGVDRADLLFPSSNRVWREGPLLHAIESNELIVKALEIAKRDPTLQVQFKSEPVLKHSPLLVIPDAWIRILKLKDGGEFGEAAIVFELDRDTESRSKIEEKLQNYLGFEEYQETFGTDVLVVAFVVSDGGAKRRDEILGIIEGYLIQTKRQEFAELFYVGTLAKDAESLYFDPTRFLKPFDQLPCSLLPLQWWRPK